MNYWLKPIGTSEEPIYNNAQAAYRDRQFFAVRPKSVKVGDILITYAVGHKVLYGAFQVVAPFETASTSLQAAEPWRKRFPHSCDTNNLLKAYSNNWSKHRLNVFHYEKQFLNVGKRVTPTASNSLNSIKLGKDKVRLTEEFAKFLMDEMRKRT